jgi:hypothetical protein
VCKDKALQLVTEQTERTNEMEKELTEAREAFEARQAVIKSEYHIHTEDAKAKMEANKARGAKLTAEVLLKRKEIQEAIDVASRRETPVSSTASVPAASKPPPPAMPQVPLLPPLQVVSPQQVSADHMFQKMQVTPGLQEWTPEQSACMAAFLASYLQTVAVDINSLQKGIVAPATTQPAGEVVDTAGQQGAQPAIQDATKMEEQLLALEVQDMNNKTSKSSALRAGRSRSPKK